jgi:hypothetical protein
MASQTTFHIDRSVSLPQLEELLAMYLRKLGASLHAQLHDIPGLASIQAAVAHSGLEDVLETAWDYISSPVRGWLFSCFSGVKLGFGTVLLGRRTRNHFASRAERRVLSLLDSIGLARPVCPHSDSRIQRDGSIGRVVVDE